MDDDEDDFYGPSASINTTAITSNATATTAVPQPTPAVGSPQQSQNPPSSANAVVVPGLSTSEPGDSSAQDHLEDIKMADGEPEELEEGEEEEEEEEEEDSDDSVSFYE